MRYYEKIFAVALLFFVVPCLVVLTIPEKQNKKQLEKEFHKDLSNFPCPPEFNNFYNGKVVNIIDGDTVDVVVQLGWGISINHRFRLYGINAPEISGEEKEFGLLSKQYLSSMIKDKDIIIYSIEDKYDKYGRFLGVLYVDENNSKKNVNLDMVLSGNAKAMNY